MITQKEAAELRRQKSEIEQQRLELKKECESKRSEMSAEDLEGAAEKLREMSESIDEINTKLEEAPEPENRGGIQMQKEMTITKDNFRSTTEYRDAFFRSFMNRKVAEGDAEIMAMGKRAITDMNGHSVTSGAEYLVPQTTLDQITSIIVKFGRLYSKITKFRFEGDVTLPIGSADAPTNEANGTDTLSFTFTEVAINQQAVVATVKVKNLLLKNSISGLESYLAMEIGKYIGLQLENYILNGDPATSKFTGILTAMTQAPSAAKTYVAMDVPTLATVMGSVESPYGDDATWVMNRKTFFNEFWGMTDANGSPLKDLVTIVGKPGSTEYYIAGLPVEFSTRMTDGDVLFFDLSQYFVNESQEITIEADASAGFTDDATVWRGKVYSGGACPLAKSVGAYYKK